MHGWLKFVMQPDTIQPSPLMDRTYVHLCCVCSLQLRDVRGRSAWRYVHYPTSTIYSLCMFITDNYQSSDPVSRSSGACALLLCDGGRNLNCAVYIVSNVADDDENTYIYYTFIIIHYTVHIISVHFSLLMHLYTPCTLCARSPSSPHCRIFAVPVACPCSQSARATTASPAPFPERVVVGRRSRSSDHHS